MKKTIVLVILLLMVPVLSVATASSAKFINGIAQIEYRSNNDSISIKVFKTKFSPTFPYQNGFRWGANEVSKPKYVVSNIQVSNGNETIYIPLSAYCDLANPNKIMLDTSRNIFSLSIIGGDAGVSYKAKITFEKINSMFYIKSRKVMHGEFPEEVWEDTRYSFIIDDGR